jgi:shikimate kinase
MKSSLALIGFMGVGKSAVAARLAERLGKTLIEVDSVIEIKAGKSIPRIFEDEGETGFREREIEAVKQVVSGRRQVVACGGGVVLNQINIDRLKQDNVIIWLRASANAIIKRTQMDARSRPILGSLQSREDLQKLMKFRLPFYERAAEITIDTNRISVEGVVEEILLKLKNYADYRS